MKPFEVMDDYRGLLPSLRAETVPAKALADWIYEWMGGPRSVIDIGCGIGNYLLPFQQKGCRVFGVDGCEVAGELIPDHFKRVDLRFPLPHEFGRFNLTICLEVAEHLPAEHADQLVANVAQVADGIVLFSAAIPWQVGTHHYNCQPPAYWIEKFAMHKIVHSREATINLQAFLKSPVFDCVPWFRDSMMLLSR